MPAHSPQFQPAPTWGHGKEIAAQAESCIIDEKVHLNAATFHLFRDFLRTARISQIHVEYRALNLVFGVEARGQFRLKPSQYYAMPARNTPSRPKRPGNSRSTKSIHSLNLFPRHALRSLLQSQVADKAKESISRVADSSDAPGGRYCPVDFLSPALFENFPR